jgi:hypothetical protein
VFDALGDLFSDERYRGCAVMNAAVEVGEEMPRVLQRAREHDAALHAWLLELSVGVAGQPSPALADAFLLLVNGAIVAAQRDRTGDPARRAQAVGRALLSSNG